MQRRWLSAATILIGLAHVVAYLVSGWVARSLLVNRTLDGERQPPERWIALLHEIILRSGVVTMTCVGVAVALVAVRSTREALSRFFYQEKGPLDLAVFRIVFFGIFFIVFDVDQTIFFSELPKALLQGLPDPLPLHRVIVPIPAITPALARVFLGCCFLGMIGLFTRAAALSVVVLGFYLFGIPQVYGKVDHYHHLLWFALILGLSPSGDALSVDALLRSFLISRDPDPPAKSRAYALPIHVIWVLFGVLYFWPGFWKLVQHGPAWVLPDNFKAHLYKKWFEEETFTPLFRIDNYPLLCTIGASFTILFELGFIFLVPFRRARRLAVFAGLTFHTLTYFFMAIAFLSLQICYSVFIDWTLVATWLGDHVIRPESGVRRRGRALLDRVRAMGRIEARRPAVASILRFVTAAPTHERSIRAVSVAGLTIGLISMGYGAMHQTDAWPFACYPTFSTLIKPEQRSLYLRIVDESAASRPVKTADIIDAFRSERWAAVLHGVVGERDAEKRQRRLEALAGVIQKLDASIRVGETIVIAEASFSTGPESGRKPRGQKTLYTHRVAARSVEPSR